MLYLPLIAIRLEGEFLYVSSPYHPAFPRRASTIGGKWMGWMERGRKEWMFDRRFEKEVRDLLVEIYGWDGTYPVLIADVLVELDRLPESWQDGQELWLLGRMLARRPGRDAFVRLGDGVAVKSGGFPESGGSRKYPALDWRTGTVLQVLDVPVTKIEAVQRKYPEAVKEIPGTRRKVLGPDQVIPVQET
jgi:hypothetical protein